VIVASFDVAVVPARLGDDGRRDISRPTWRRVVTVGETLTDAHLAAAQLAGTRGMVVDVLYRE
jgi:hypothetical protein